MHCHSTKDRGPKSFFSETEKSGAQPRVEARLYLGEETAGKQAAADQGTAMDFDKQLDRHRAYLEMWAKMNFDRRFERRFDASDIVQETLKEAHLQRDKFRGDNSAQLAGWLRQILNNNMIDAARREGRGKRDMNLERSVEAMNRSSLRMEAVLKGDQTSPSECVMRHEQLVTMARALEKIPSDQAEAVRMKHLQGLSLKEIATAMERSTEAVAGLLHRGLKRLREIMDKQE